MKRFTFIVSCFFSLKLFAVPVGNPAEPALIPKGLIFEENPYLNLRLGYISNYVLKSRFQNQQGVSIDTKYFSYLGKITLNIRERVDIYTLFGSTRGKSQQIINEQTSVLIPSKLMISVGGGIKAILLNYRDKTFVGIDGKYFRYYPDVDHMVVNGSPSIISQTELKSWQWEFSFALSHKFSFFIPYVGTSFFLSRLKPLPSNAFIVNAKERTNWGLFVGSTLTKGDTISLNAEAKFFNQNEYGVSVEFRY